ncbi:O-antigen ligase family protein [Mongoliitalea lutea]|uniref:O-antigen ligase-related domain-containing protein n=1 Tax=Mongoliitalea lutea TaxID=849756 RepID=A0A8J3CXJ6_9BACT|nr:O-antigen ligase family protein [Mongoliitalea lutea]GHB40241.1 hypothetical protein GCM10008106_21810 [Mongoliitalea lutea]
MSLIVFLLIAVLTVILTTWVMRKIVLEGKYEYAIFFVLYYLPFYVTGLGLVYMPTRSVLIVNVFQYLKELVLFTAVLSFVFYQKSLFQYPFRLHKVDILFLAFIGMGFLYMLLPLGEADPVSKAVYFKNMLMPALVYFLARNTEFDKSDTNDLFRGIFTIAILAFLVNVGEKLAATHLQSHTGFALYFSEVREMEPSGNYGLAWTFETQSTGRRFASFFADPLELASSVLLGFSAGLIWYLTSKREDWTLYGIVMGASFASLLFSASRAAFASFFVMIFFIAVIFRLYRLILVGAFLFFAFVGFVLFFATEDFYFFVVDTITFENTSSVGHLVEWLLALESMVANPLGVGLAMSGNVGVVDEEFRVGGENQYLIYGVQLGWIGMFLYILILAYGIKTCIQVFRQSDNIMTARIAFVGAAVKVGLLLPLFTANAELYSYVAWMSWWMVGYSVNAFQRIRYPKAVAA